jgi:hypothetical protein
MKKVLLLTGLFVLNLGATEVKDEFFKKLSTNPNSKAYKGRTSVSYNDESRHCDVNLNDEAKSEGVDQIIGYTKADNKVIVYSKNKYTDCKGVVVSKSKIELVDREELEDMSGLLSYEVELKENDYILTKRFENSEHEIKVKMNEDKITIEQKEMKENNIMATSKGVLTYTNIPDSSEFQEVDVYVKTKDKSVLLGKYKDVNGTLK